MTVKDAIIALCFIGSIGLAIIGGWGYMKGRVVLYQEKVRIDKIQARTQTYYNAEEELKKIKKEKTNALILFAVGVSGIYLIINYIHRRTNIPTRLTIKKTR